MLRNRKKLIIIIDACVLIAAAIVFLVFFSGGGNEISYWPDNPPDAETVKTTLWEFDRTQIGEDETILSISPSGKYILTAEASGQDLGKQLLTGKNARGWIIGYMALYENKDGAYTLAARIDTDADPELNDTLASCREDGVAWLGDKPRLCVTAGIEEMRPNIARGANADIFLVDFTAQSVKNLTGRGYSTADLLPRWNGGDDVYFIRHYLDERRMARIRLMSVDVPSGEVKVEVDLSQDGIPAIVLDFAMYEGTAYYSVYGSGLERSGLYKAMAGDSNEPPTQMLSVAELREESIHPYTNSLTSVQISPDGRYLCLTASDGRSSADYPLADIWPQDLPPGAERVHCHNVLLYDLRIKELINPFTDAALQPDVAIAMTAAFAPDGKSLLCSVFGDGVPWKKSNFGITALHQIRLDSSTFDTMRIYTAEVGFLPEQLAWHGNNSISMCWQSNLLKLVKLVIPAAFKRLAG